MEYLLAKLFKSNMIRVLLMLFFLELHASLSPGSQIRYVCFDIPWCI
ncbi:hypothetical protein SNE25_04895 [Mucilaginibacter sabulilitoris]|uniref:Uncharacterized protein n=1 Tax=Mucilaginibacter sabulilitoris TaxID=1173583 RepID=A0ABZ0TUP2_9SPHI|nr:hypothetical protein [Mucilaginibacter sabulilitoris]WPU94855.1 hypothetical protein SNE25_04895 [Mucilaginibacter sabulilitoris]